MTTIVNPYQEIFEALEYIVKNIDFANLTILPCPSENGPGFFVQNNDNKRSVILSLQKLDRNCGDEDDYFYLWNCQHTEPHSSFSDIRNGSFSSSVIVDDRVFRSSSWTIPFVAIGKQDFKLRLPEIVKMISDTIIFWMY